MTRNSSASAFWPVICLTYGSICPHNRPVDLTCVFFDAYCFLTCHNRPVMSSALDHMPVGHRVRCSGLESYLFLVIYSRSVTCRKFAAVCRKIASFFPLCICNGLLLVGLVICSLYTIAQVFCFFVCMILRSPQTVLSFEQGLTILLVCSSNSGSSSSCCCFSVGVEVYGAGCKQWPSGREQGVRALVHTGQETRQTDLMCTQLSVTLWPQPRYKPNAARVERMLWWRHSFSCRW